MRHKKADFGKISTMKSANKVKFTSPTNPHSYNDNISNLKNILIIEFLNSNKGFHILGSLSTLLRIE